jgi:hypothetical protein
LHEPDQLLLVRLAELVQYEVGHPIFGCFKLRESRSLLSPEPLIFFFSVALALLRRQLRIGLRYSGAPSRLRRALQRHLSARRPPAGEQPC